MSTIQKHISDAKSSLGLISLALSELAVYAMASRLTPKELRYAALKLAAAAGHLSDSRIAMRELSDAVLANSTALTKDLIEEYSQLRALYRTFLAELEMLRQDLDTNASKMALVGGLK